MYVLMFELCEECYELIQLKEELRLDWVYCSKEIYFFFIMKYKFQLNLWEDVFLFDYLNLRYDFCIVVKGNFVYFIGGVEWYDIGYMYFVDVERYDFSKNQWDKVVDL